MHRINRVFFNRLLFPVRCQQRNAPKTTETTLTTRTVNFFFRDQLMLTNCVSSGAFLFLGDLINQEVESRMQLHTKDSYDWMRLGRMFAVGVLIGPLHHYYYTRLDMLLPKSDFRTATIKVVSDQAVCSPLTILLFFWGVGILEKKSQDEIIEEIDNKFKYVYLGDCLFWPPIQYYNFVYLSSKYRVFYINVATMIYDVFLSFMKHEWD